jgi:hypothetical protein
MIPQSYPLKAVRYEEVDRIDGSPIYRSTGETHAVIGWVEVTGTADDVRRFRPVLASIQDLAEVAFVPKPDEQYEFYDPS